jgi:hypothetical protein
VTAVAAVRVLGEPSLVGDVVLTVSGQRVDHAGKVYVVAPNVAMGWSGNLSVADPAMRRLRGGLQGLVASTADLGLVLDTLEDLRNRPRETLELTGWIVAPGGPKVIRWASHYDPVRFCDAEHAIGDGGPELRRMLAEPEIGKGNSEGHDKVPLRLISGFCEARFEETLRGAAWPQTWGAAYDAITYQEGNFRWLPKLTYVGWDVVVDDRDRITSVTQAPVLFTQEHVHPCTLMLAKRVGDPDHDVEISYPIDRDVDLDMYRRRPYSVVSYYYANFFRVFLPSGHLMTMYLAAKNATPNGVMHHAGVDEADPRFQVNLNALQPMVNEMLEKARASYAQRQSDP